MCVCVNRGSKCQLSMTHIEGEGPDGTAGTHTFTSETWHRLLVLLQEDLPALPHRHTGVPTLVHWIDMTILAQ